MRTCSVHPQADPEISRFPCKELPHMPGSSTTPGRAGARTNASVHVAFRDHDHVGTRDYRPFAALWLACALPGRRFADTLADASARLGANADCYSFIAVDLHHLLFAGFYRRSMIVVWAREIPRSAIISTRSRKLFEPQIPADAQDDDLPVEMAAFEKIINAQHQGSIPPKTSLR